MAPPRFPPLANVASTRVETTVLADHRRVILDPADDSTRIEGHLAIRVGAPPPAASRIVIDVPRRGRLASFWLRQRATDGRATLEPVRRPPHQGRRVVLPIPAAPPGTLLEWRWQIDVDGLVRAGRHAPPAGLPIEAARLEVLGPSLHLVADADHYARVHPTTWRLNRWQPPTPRPFAPRDEAGPSVRWTIRAIGGRGVTQTWAQAAADIWDTTGADIEGPLPGPPRANDGPRPARIEATWQAIQSRFDAGEPGARRPPRLLGAATRASADERALCLLAALTAQGIPAALALVPPVGRPALQANLPASTLDGDLIVAVPDARGHLWLDPACRGCTIGQLAPQHRGRHGVLMRPPCPGRPWWTHARCRLAAPAAELIVTPTQARFVRPTHLEQTLRGLADGLRVERWRQTVHGARAAGIRARRRGHRLAVIDRPPVRGGRLALDGLDDHGQPLILTITDARAPATLAPARLNPQPWLRFAPDRAVPIDFVEPPDFTHEARLAGLVPASGPPAPARVESLFGRYVLEVDAYDGGVEIAERLVVHRRRIEVAELPAWRRFVQAIRAARGAR